MENFTFYCPFIKRFYKIVYPSWLLAKALLPNVAKSDSKGPKVTETDQKWLKNDQKWLLTCNTHTIHHKTKLVYGVRWGNTSQLNTSGATFGQKWKIGVDIVRCWHSVQNQIAFSSVGLHRFWILGSKDWLLVSFINPLMKFFIWFSINFNYVWVFLSALPEKYGVKYIENWREKNLLH